jgi:DNA-binding transcriptional MerR regulator
LAEARKSDQAFRTIGELAEDLGVPQHILRYWETRFPQLRPLQRAGNRRYYRPADVALAHRIHRLLNQDGYTIRGVQQLLASGAPDGEDLAPPPRGTGKPEGGGSTEDLRRLRKTLRDALDES